MLTKTCRMCGLEKPESEFWFNKKLQRLNPRCLVCAAAVRKAWKAANPDKVRELNRAWQSRNPDRTRAAQERWNAKHPGLADQRSREWYAANRDTVRTRERGRYHAVKAEVYAAYGSRCSCCGEDQPEFLSIDHVHNDGCVRRKELGYGYGQRGGGVRLYRQIADEGFPPTYQILCMNCNFGKARNKGVCPHVTVTVQRPFRKEVGASAPKRPALVCT